MAKGIFEYTAGNAYKISLSGSSTATGATKSDFTVAFKNTIDLGMSNGLKWSFDVGAEKGTSYKYKGASEIGFAKNSIGVSEYAGSRCLDLFQASAGLGTITRAAFVAQNKAQNVAMWSVVAAGVVSQVASALFASLGKGFQDQDNKWSAAAAFEPLGSAVVPLAAMFTMCKFYLEKVEEDSKPQDWNPNAVLQASAEKGILIASRPGVAGKLNSFLLQNEDGSTLTVFSQPNAKFAGDDLVVGIGKGLDKQQHLTGFKGPGSWTKSELKMTDSTVNIQTKELSLVGKSGIGSNTSGGTKYSADFQTIGLTAKNAAATSTASITLDGTKPSVNMKAQAASNTSVSLNQTKIEMKSAETYLGLTNTSATLKAASLNLKGTTSAELSAAQIKINGSTSVVIAANGVIRLQ